MEEFLTTSSTSAAQSGRTEGHYVHLYGRDDAGLVEGVTRFLLDGARRGDGLLVVATPAHTGAIRERLEPDAAYRRLDAEGRVSWLDADRTLERLLVNGEPHWSRFLLEVGDGLRNLQERGGEHAGISAFGELVGLLWARGQHASAARVEDYWNRLIEVTGCTLYCGYPVDVLGRQFDADTMDTIFCQHTHVLTADQRLELSLGRAIREVLGARVESLRHMARHPGRPEWGDLPGGERLALWVRQQFSAEAPAIFARARTYLA